MSMSNDIFKGTKLLQRALDASWIRNKVISNNIANAETPGYKRQKVQFEQFLSDAQNDNPTIKIEQDNSGAMRQDGNNVDIENEMAQMAKNNLMYNALIQKITGEFNKLRSAISEGRK
jgi:flagellar basal-body rod protein FlgB